MKWEAVTVGISFPAAPHARTCALLPAQFCGLIAGMPKIESMPLSLLCSFQPKRL
jgi:hypothetical protein